MNPNDGQQGQQPYPQQPYQQQPAQPQPYQQQGYQLQGYPGGPVQSVATGPNPIGGGLVILGGLVAAIAAFLAWVTLSGQGPDGQSVTLTVSGIGSVSGADVGSTGATDGWITFGAGIVALVAGALALARKGGRGLQTVAILAGVVVAGVPVYDLIKSNSDLQSLKDQGVDVSYSIGIWLTIVGGVVIVLGAIIAMVGARKQN